MKDERLQANREQAITTLVVPLDGSPLAEAAVPVARRLARQLDASLRLVSAVGSGAEVDERRAALEACGEDDVPTERAVLVESDPVAAILAQLDGTGAAAVCMATRGRGRSAAVLGSVALGTVTRLGEPVVLVGPGLGQLAGAGTPSAGVLACLDGSAESETGLGPARRWARQLREPITLCTAAEDVPSPPTGSPPRRRFGLPDPEPYLAGHADRLRRQGEERVETLVVYDPISPAEALRSHMARQGVALVVAGTRGRTGLSRAVVGSVAASVVRDSAAPVLLVPPPPGSGGAS